MALSFIGKPISLISHSDVRYRGILAGIDPVASTIQLSNVYSMGTESRRPPHDFIPPVPDPYEYIIFRASEVKDLTVDEPVPQRSVHDDPAVLGASAPGTISNAGYSSYPAPAAGAPVPPAVPQQPQTNYPRQAQAPKPAVPQQAHQTQSQAQSPQPPTTTQQQQQQSQQQPPPQQQQRAQTNSGPNRRGANSVQNAAASLESVERALGDLRVNNAHPAPSGARGGRRGGAAGGGGRRNAEPTEQLRVPTTDFDFETMNAKFNKVALSQQQQQAAADGNDDDGAAAAADGSPDGENQESVGGDNGGATGPAAEKKREAAYNPQKSFFDSLSSSASTPPAPAQGGNNASGGRGRRGGGGGSAGRNRREEERERNVATFGEPGGVGLLGPGAYVGGWGGYGRRGGRPRRGGGQGNQGQIVSTRG